MELIINRIFKEHFEPHLTSARKESEVKTRIVIRNKQTDNKNLTNPSKEIKSEVSNERR